MSLNRVKRGMVFQRKGENFNEKTEKVPHLAWGSSPSGKTYKQSNGNPGRLAARALSLMNVGKRLQTRLLPIYLLCR